MKFDDPNASSIAGPKAQLFSKALYRSREFVPEIFQ